MNVTVGGLFVASTISSQPVAAYINVSVNSDPQQKFYASFLEST
jgi:hypothetical protein